MRSGKRRSDALNPNFVGACRYRAGPSDSLLGFDCGGQQLVLETAFSTGTLE